VQDDFHAEPELTFPHLTWHHTKEGNLTITPCILFAEEGTLGSVVRPPK